MNQKQILQIAKRLISKPENWIRDYYAKDIDGNRVEIENPKACRFCSMGAIYKASLRKGSVQAQSALASAIPAEFDYNVSEFNDNPKTTHADIMAAFDRAIAQLSWGKSKQD